MRVKFLVAVASVELSPVLKILVLPVDGSIGFPVGKKDSSPVRKLTNEIPCTKRESVRPDPQVSISLRTFDISNLRHGIGDKASPKRTGSLDTPGTGQTGRVKGDLSSAGKIIIIRQGYSKSVASTVRNALAYPPQLPCIWTQELKYSP